MREIRIAGRNEVIVTGASARAERPFSNGGAPAASAPWLRRGAVAGIGAAALVAAIAVPLVTFTSAPARPAHPAAAEVRAEPPIYDPASGKVANRLDGAKSAGDPILPMRVSTAGLFGRWLDGSAPALAVLSEAAAEARPARVATRRPTVKVAAAPLPPVRPASLGEVATVAATVQPAGATRILGFVPSELLPWPRTALRKVASLGDAFLERVSP